MSAGDYDIVVEQGVDQLLNTTWTDPNNVPIDITGYTAVMQVRKGFKSTDVILELTSPVTIILGGVNGTVDLVFEKATISALEPDKYVYDIELSSSLGITSRYLQGAFTVSPEVTR